MSMQVRCLICGEILKCKPNDTANLLEHVRKRHPDVNLQSSTSNSCSSRNSNNRLYRRGSLLVKSNKSQKHIFAAPRIFGRSNQICVEGETSKKKSSTEYFDARPKQTRDSKCKLTDQPHLNPELRPYEYESKHSIPSKTCEADVIAYESKHRLPDKFVEAEIVSFGPDHKCAFGDDRPPSRVISITRTSDLNLKPPTPTLISNTTIETKSSDRNLDENCIKTDKDNVLFRRKYSVKNPFPFSTKGKEKLYKTSIEKWRPGKGRIACPSCGAIRKPVIKSHLEKSSTTPYGAACILTCWPFCFLPCLFPPPAKEYLHCSNCNYFLGIYDRKTEIIEPSDLSCNK